MRRSHPRYVPVLSAAAIAISTATADAATQTPSSASGLDYPSRPIRMRVGFSPGGGTDVAARIIGKKLAETWNQQSSSTTAPVQAVSLHST